MPLKDTLQALKYMILNSDSLPQEPELRQKVIQDHNPNLTEVEAKDLAKNNLENIKIYKTTILSGEAKILRNHFAATLKLLGKIAGDNIPNCELAININKEFPWKSSRVAEFAHNFVKYLQLKYSLEHPALIEIAEFEYTHLIVKRAKITRFTNQQAFENMQIGELLSKKIALHDSIKTLSLTYDCYHFYQAIHAKKDLEIAKSDNCLIAFQDSNALPVWKLISADEYSFLNNLNSELDLENNLDKNKLMASEVSFRNALALLLMLSSSGLIKIS